MPAPTTTTRLSRVERRQRTRDELLDAAERRFSARGFQACSLDEIATEAGYTKGAVYSNFASKEDLFLAVYERRAERAVAEVERIVADLGPAEALHRVAEDTARRRGEDDGWLAVFFEFWAHVVRHPELRGRFAAIHARAQAPFVAALADLADAGEIALPMEARSLTAAMVAMQLGLSLERLTQPGIVDVTLGARMSRLVLDDLLREAGS